MVKRCSNCKKEKPFTDFYFYNSKTRGYSWYSSYCKKCQAQLQRTHRYGITVKQIRELKKSQLNCCAICKEKLKKIFNIDHCHVTGKVRGILCTRCNTGLGKFKDSTILLTEAFVYLSKYGDEHQKNH